MTSPNGRRLHLAAALDHSPDHGGVPCLEPARLAERGALDFVTLGDDAARPGTEALAVLSRVAPATHRVGLVPTVPTACTGPLGEPFDVQAAVADLDRVSRGRAGWRIGASTTEGAAADAAARLWGGREGASIVPGPAQGRPVRVLDATEPPARPAGARYADVVLVRTASPAEAAAVRAGLRASAAEYGRDPDGLRVLVSLGIDLGDGEYAADPGHGGGGPRATRRGPLYRGGPVGLADLIAAWHREGAVDGFHLVPAEPRRDLERLVNGTVSLLQHRGLFRTFYPGSTLRDHLGLRRPADRHPVTGRA
ncbi:LLM class flavin-dependent oxidoreductase [Streptomyces sp. TRM S81-3]|uniref:LLM class flavin-dependent oxidoreductase n=1 Tax=Streptomyces griseicoloratus TaxID=2752516 RepID=A0A926L3P7_9ACTN|nr:LLM class flavin-dependent oxidoreductase [Streptomyces griseicoloratus]MBD0419697.1 LLM class flavin-dependent oxidoreductase [Streptomyces griseicoloratus]